MVPVHALVTTGINADGHREILAIQVTTSEDGIRSWARLARVLPRPDRPRPDRVRLVTSDAHAGLVDAIAANLPGATWQRCRTHYAEVRIMPRLVVSALVVRAGGLLRSA